MDKVMCECGKSISCSSMKKHKETDKHKNNIESKIKEIEKITSMDREH